MDRTKTIFILICGLILSLCNAPPSVAVESVVLQLKWFHQFQFAGYYAAKEKGYYAEAGFDVEIVERNPEFSLIDVVLSGDADFGIYDSGLILHRMRGKSVVVLGAIFQHSPLVLLTRSADGYLGPYELKNKRVMYQDNLDDATLTAMFHTLGMKTQDIVHVPHTFDDDALLNGEVDAMSAYLTNQPFYYAERGVAVHIINPLNYGIDFYGDMLFTSEEEARRDPQRVRRLLNASLHGWQYALENKEEVIGWLKSKYPSNESLASLRFEADETEKMILPKLVTIGYMNTSRFQRIAEIYRQLNLVPVGSNYDGIDFKDYISQTQGPPFWLNLLGGIAGVLLFGTIALLVLNRRLNNLVKIRTLVLERQATKLKNFAKSQAALNECLKYEVDVKNRFFSIISHDLKSPFNSLLGMTHMMSKMADNLTKTKLVEYANDVHETGELTYQLLQNLLEWSRLQMEGATLDPEMLSLDVIINESLELLKPIALKKNIELTNNVSKTSVFADQYMVKMIIRNLIANALKFTPSGGSVGITQSTKDDLVQITVSDTGVGISKEQAKILFALDKKTSTIGTSGEKGTGLGLPLCKDLLERYGGCIWVDSSLGHGSKFHFTLPNAPKAGIILQK